MRDPLGFFNIQFVANIEKMKEDSSDLEILDKKTYKAEKSNDGLFSLVRLCILP